MRLPLSTDLKTRTGAPDKDARLKNAYIEVKGDQSVVRKRPAAQGGVPTSAGIAQGGIPLNINSVLVWNGDTMTTITTGTTWSARTAYLTGDHVAVDFVDYWAVNDNSGSMPPSANWSRSYVPARNYFTKLVGVGQYRDVPSTASYISTDGRTWTSQTSFMSGVWTGVAWSRPLSLWCCIGFDSATTTIKIYTSPDAVTWTLRTTPVIAQSGVYHPKVIWSKVASKFIAATDSGILSSADGITWSLLSTANQLQEVAESATTICVCSTNGAYTSTNGTAWTLTAYPVIFAEVAAMSYLNGKFRGIGTYPGLNSYYVSSNDGANWTLGAALPNIPAGPVPYPLAGITYSTTLNRLVYVQISNIGIGGGYSDDNGTTWTAITTGSACVKWVSSLSQFSTGRGDYSSDGITWNNSAIQTIAYIASDE